MVWEKFVHKGINMKEINIEETNKIETNKTLLFISVQYLLLSLYSAFIGFFVVLFLLKADSFDFFTIIFLIVGVLHLVVFTKAFERSLLDVQIEQGLESALNYKIKG